MKVKAPSVPVPKAEQRAARELAELRRFDAKDVDAYLEILQGSSLFKPGAALPAPIARLAADGSKGKAAARATVGTELQRDIAAAGLTLSELAKDGKLEGAELVRLAGVVGRMRAALAMRDDAALAMLDKKTRTRLTDALFTPLATLLARADQAIEALEGAPAAAPKPTKVSGPRIAAGGVETTGVEILAMGPHEAGLFTSRGPNKAEHGVSYKSYDEDGVGAGSFGAVHFLTACDQAGGMGQIPGQTGAASKVAVEEIQAAAKRVHEGAKPKAALVEAVETAQARILALNAAHGVEAVTTMTGAVLVGDTAHLVNVGDSKAWHFAADGTVKNESRPHNLGDRTAEKTGDPNKGLDVSNIITECLGSEPPNPDFYAWKLAPGDLILIASDGVVDANLVAQERAFDAGDKWTRHNGEITTHHLAGALAGAKDAAEAAEAVRAYTFAQMAARKGKPDNVGFVLLRVGS